MRVPGPIGPLTTDRKGVEGYEAPVLIRYPEPVSAIFRGVPVVIVFVSYLPMRRLLTPQAANGSPSLII